MKTAAPERVESEKNSHGLWLESERGCIESDEISRSDEPEHSRSDSENAFA